MEVKINEKTRVIANDAPPELQIIPFSNLDLLSGRFPITYLYFYRELPNNNHTSPLDNLKISLSKTMTCFFPFAGQIVHNTISNTLEIVCDNNGALIVEAEANISLKELDFHNIDTYLRKLVTVDHEEYLVRVQVTTFRCGSLAIAFTFDHALGDAAAFGKFLVTWSEIARDSLISCLPDHQRNLQPRSPPNYDATLDRTFTTITMEEIQSLPTMEVLLKRLYYVDHSSINHLSK